MTGLRHHERDARLPSLLGEPHLVPPSEDHVAELVGAVLLHEQSPALTDVTWEYARYKPGVSITCAWRLLFADGAERLVAGKRYADGKAASLAEREPASAALEALCGRLVPRAILAERALTLWAFPADRMLTGLEALLDARMVARVVENAGRLPPRSVRRKTVTTTLLRYKPERRAVFAIDLPSRDASLAAVRLAGRSLPPERLREVHATRLAFEGCGYLLEEWLDLDPRVPGSFADPELAGRLLARLHALPLPLPETVRDARGTSALDLARLFGREPALARLAARVVDVPACARATWSHGDFHADQIASERGARGIALLDLDLLGRGAPRDDLASWIADRLSEDDVSFEEAAEPLLDGYRGAGGAPPGSKELRAAAAQELVRRAAGALRRLERDAVEKAERRLERAIALGRAGATPP